MGIYCTPAQFLQRYDARTIGQLVSDDGTVMSPTDLSTAAAGSVLYSHLQSASGKIESALLEGERYQISDLQSIASVNTATDPNNPLAQSAAYLIQLCADIAFASLWRRRPWSKDDRGDLVYQQAEAELNRLKDGEAVFNLAGVEGAGNAWIGGPSRVQLRQLNMLPDQCRPRYYPIRQTPNNR